MNILAVGAHFDDVELGCGGALVRHAEKGDSVYIYVATLSGYSNYHKESVRGNGIALAEGRAASKILGAELICGGFETLKLEFCEDLNAALVKIIDQKKIDQIYTHWIGDIHHDHSALAKSTLHSGRHVGRMLAYRSNWYNSSFEFRGNFYVDITDAWDKKEKAIKAHRSEYKRTGQKWIKFFKNEAENTGQKIGVKYAEAFEVIKWVE